MTTPLKTAVVTGATDGIGRQTALVLATRHDFRVLVHGRTQAKAHAAADALTQAGAKAVAPVWGDLASFESTRALAAQVLELAPRLDVLLNNAGVFMKAREVSVDGHELTFQVNHLAPFLLTHLVLPSLKAAAAARVVNVSSVAHQRGRIKLDDLESTQGFNGYAVYAASKLLNLHFTHELARRLAKTAVVTSALHPGVITTKLLQTGFGVSGASVDEGARTSVYCATDEAVGQVSGRYYSDSREVPCSAHAKNEALEKSLYDESCRITGVAPLEPAPTR